ncbi:MAG TPA: TadE/TadG family type IV pilus assembly protein [Rhizomicrobium sp.]|jgi:Flp pilus assembly protein TadG|nr:TadE/TadG family type IV pilus assembly protein [Rhizomicrobium sp.]
MSRILRNKSVGRAAGFHAGLRSQSGVAAIEFAFLAPILLLIITGVCQFTMVLGNYMTLEHAVGAGARVLAISRGDSTPVSDTQTQIYTSAGNLNTSNITISYAVNGAACSGDTGCSTALAAGVPAQVTASYPCSLVVMGTNFAPGCTLSVAATERVE